MEIDYGSLYRVLGLEPGCSHQELRQTYRRLVRAWHPDHRPKSTDQAESDDRIKEITRAYRHLLAYYKRHGELPLSEPAPAATPASYAEPPSRPTDGADRNPPPTPSTSRLTRAPALLAFGAMLALGYGAVSRVMEAPEGRPAADRRVAEPHVEKSPTANVNKPIEEPAPFMVGSTLGDVIAAQGPPTRTEGNIWHYGKSRVHFQNGRVTHWHHDADNPLNARLATVPAPDPVQYFTIGSDKAAVRAAQGPPIFESETMWDYGTARVFFEDGRVSRWEDSPLSPLRARR